MCIIDDIFEYVFETIHMSLERTVLDASDSANRIGCPKEGRPLGAAS